MASKEPTYGWLLGQLSELLLHRLHHTLLVRLVVPFDQGLLWLIHFLLQRVIRIEVSQVPTAS